MKVAMRFGFLVVLLLSDNFGFGLEIKLDGLRNSKGNICYSITDIEQNFLNEEKNLQMGDCFKVKPLFFIDVKKYKFKSQKVAIAVFHDENQDKVLNAGSWFGIPEEGFGFSGNPSILTGPPSFEDALINPFVDKSIEIEIKYFL